MAAASAHLPGGAVDAAEPVAIERRRFGKTDMNVGVLGFGGAESDYEKASPETVAKLLNSAIDGGLIYKSMPNGQPVKLS